MGVRTFVVELACWWAVAIGVWLVTLSSVNAQDLVAAIVLGLPCALAACAGRRAVEGSWAPEPRWVAWLPALAAAVLADTARMARFVLRRDRGDPGTRFRTVELATSGPNAGHEALATLALSATPATFVADVDPDRDVVVVHEVVAGTPHLDRVVRR